VSRLLELARPFGAAIALGMIARAAVIIAVNDTIVRVVRFG
jgi:hypothetical protein